MLCLQGCDTHNGRSPITFPIPASDRRSATLEVAVRVNIEESVFEHIPRLAAEAGLTFDTALGRLVRVYRASQAAELYEDTPARILTVCALCFDCDADGERFLTAMIRAQLASVLADGRVRIRGNEEHVKRLNTYRARASSGGIAKNRKPNDFVASKHAVAKHTGTLQPATPLSYNVPSYAPILLNTNTGSDLHSHTHVEAISEDVQPAMTPVCVVDESKGLALAPFVLAEFRRSALEHQRPVAENFGKRDTWDAAAIVAKYPQAWKQIISRYHAEQFYERFGWSLKYLAKNIDQIANRLGGAPKTDADYLAMKIGF